MANDPAWWRDEAFANCVTEAQGSFVELRDSVAHEISYIREKGFVREDLVVGFVRYLALPGAEGRDWTLCSDTFDLMPMPLSPDQRIRLFRSDCGWGAVQHLRDFTREEFFTAAVECVVGLCLNRRQMNILSQEDAIRR